jgi:hypothetical protein
VFLAVRYLVWHYNLSLFCAVCFQPVSTGTCALDYKRLNVLCVYTFCILRTRLFLLCKLIFMYISALQKMWLKVSFTRLKIHSISFTGNSFSTSHVFVIVSVI